MVHPAPGHGSGTLVNALLNHCSDLSGIGGVERPGIVHRLDKDTSGIVLVAKNETAHRVLARQFKNRQVEKVYLALVRGTVKKKSGTIEAPIGRHKINRKKMSADTDRGRQAQTRYEVLETFGHFSYVRLFPKTGRTHQIRVHLASIHHPVLGDALYGGKVAPPPPEDAPAGPARTSTGNSPPHHWKPHGFRIAPCPRYHRIPRSSPSIPPRKPEYNHHPRNP